jgi:hypothetical protein
MFMHEAMAASQAIEVTIEELEEIANSALPDLESDASNTAKPFADEALPPSAFGNVPRGLALAGQHGAAHAVMSETIEGVIADLRLFQERILAAARNHRNADEGAQAALIALGRRYESHQFQSDQNKDAASSEHRDELAVPGAPAVEPGPADSGAETAPDFATPSESATPDERAQVEPPAPNAFTDGGSAFDSSPAFR